MGKSQAGKADTAFCLSLLGSRLDLGVTSLLPSYEQKGEISTGKKNQFKYIYGVDLSPVC